MKRVFCWTISMILLVGLGYYASVERTSNVKAASVPEDELCETPKEFTGKTITYKPNRYCKTTCTPKGSTSFPNTVQTVNVDQTVNAGGQFQWEEIRIKTEMECETEIYYDQWYADWTAAVAKLKEALRMIAKEAHQYQTDHDTGQACEIRNYSNNCREVNLSEYLTTATSYVGYLSQLSLIEEFSKNDSQSSRTPSSIGRSWQAPGEPIRETKPLIQCVSPDKDEMSEGCEWGCPGFKVGQDANGNSICVKETSTTVTKYCVKDYTSQKGTIHVYSNVQCGDTANTCHPTATKRYCSVSKPYWDDATFDNYWYNVYRDAVNTLSKLNSQGLPSQLEACNDNGFEKIYKKSEDPRTIVHYDEPMGKYNDAKNLRLTTKVVSGPTYTEDASGTVYVTNGKQNLPSIKSQVDGVTSKSALIGTSWNWGNIYQDITVTEYAKWAKYKVRGKITTEYKYEMPDGFYQYTEKPNGNVQHASQLKPSVLESGNYIDVGFSNYPVHYQTPTGVYPISLTYNMPLVFDGDRLYTCIYRVKNKIACPEGECPDPGTETPPGDGDNPPVPEDPNDPGDPFSGLNVVYRPISLSEPFHYRNGKVRPAGSNWTTEDIATYIHNNRNQRNDNVYNTSPIYEFTLDAMDISEIRKYNSSHEFSDFKLTCKGKDSNGNSIGTRCYSDFLKDYYNRLDAKGACVNTSVSNFYRCANKPVDQDKDIVNKVQGKN